MLITVSFFGGNHDPLFGLSMNFLGASLTLVRKHEVNEKWWARKDLNLRPADYESDALTN